MWKAAQDFWCIRQVNLEWEKGIGHVFDIFLQPWHSYTPPHDLLSVYGFWVKTETLRRSTGRIL